MTCARWIAPAMLLLSSTAAAQATARDSSRRALSEYARRAGALGVSGVLLVADADEVLLHAAMGWRDPARRVPNDTSSLFYIASLSKQFVAAAVLRLEDEGRLRTTDSIGAFFPALPSDKRSITVDALLHHTSGLPRYGFDMERRDWAVVARDEAVRGILGARLSERPGSRFDYQNSNYILLTAIVEQVAQTSIASYLDSALLRPAGVRDTYIGSRITSALRARVVWSVGDHAESFTILDRPDSYLRMGRGVVTTARDLHRWVRAIAGGRVLSDTARRKLFSIGAHLEPGYGYGAGWYVRADSTGAPRIVFHGGDLGGYRSEVRYAPATGRILIALTNVAYRGGSLTETLLNDATDVGFRGAPNPLPEVAAGPLAATRLLAGEYRTPSGEVLVVSPAGASLTLEPSGQRAVDWLLTADTAGWAARRRAATAAMALIDSLQQGATLAGPSGRRFSAAQRQDVFLEWNRIRRRGGRLKSYQLLGASSERSDGFVTLIRLVLERDSLLFGVGWVGDTLSYTAPGLGNLVQPVVFAPLTDRAWASYEWTSGTTRRMSFAPGRPAPERPRELVLETLRGPVRFSRRIEGHSPQ